MNEIRISFENGRACIHSPYNADYVKSIKKIGGARWNAEDRCWCVPEHMVSAAREILMQTYGYTDQTPNETVTLQLTFNEYQAALREPCTYFGKTVAKAYGRDSGAKVGDDVALISGRIASGGSVKNWTSYIYEGTVVKLYNVNKAIYEREIANISADEITVEIVDESVINEPELRAERERLLQRIAEIDALLNKN